MPPQREENTGGNKLIQNLTLIMLAGGALTALMLVGRFASLPNRVDQLESDMRSVIKDVLRGEANGTVMSSSVQAAVRQSDQAKVDAENAVVFAEEAKRSVEKLSRTSTDK